MTISAVAEYSIDDIGLTSGRVYRVGENGVVISGNMIAAFNDDGVVFQALEFVDNPGGWGSVTPYHVHDNENGTMNVYFRLTGPSIPLTHTDAYVTVNSSSGAVIGDMNELPYASSSGTGGMGHTNSAGHADGQMLQQALSLSDGTIALIDTSTILNQFVFKIVTADGAHVAISASLGTGVTSSTQQLLFDMTEVGDQIAVAWANPGGTGTPAHVRFLNRDGSFASDAIAVGRSTSTGFGNTPAVQIETLSDGRIVVVWVENGTNSGPDTDQTSTWFTILNANGSEAVGPTLVNQDITAARQDTPLLITTENGFVIGYSVLDFRGTQEGRLREYDNDGNLLDTVTRAYTWGVDDIVRTDNNTAFILGGSIVEVTLPGSDTPLTSGGGGGGGTNTIAGTRNNDTLRGGSQDDEIVGKGGRDKLVGAQGNDTLDGGKGNDKLFGNAGRDKLLGGSGNDKLVGSSGNDTLNSGNGNDKLFGGSGRDKLNGGSGSDTLDGGSGNDKLTGGRGNDTFVFSEGRDVVTDFNANSSGERIDLRGVSSISDFSDLMDNHVERVNGNVIIDDLAGNTLTLNGIRLSSLSEDDFIF